jgi:hypothetical protein
MSAVIFFACLDLEQKSSVMDGRKLINLRILRKQIKSVERISQAPFIYVRFETVEQFEKIQTPCNRSGGMLILFLKNKKHQLMGYPHGF